MMNKNDDVNFDDVGWIIGEEENKNQIQDFRFYFFFEKKKRKRKTDIQRISIIFFVFKKANRKCSRLSSFSKRHTQLFFPGDNLIDFFSGILTKKLSMFFSIYSQYMMEF